MRVFVASPDRGLVEAVLAHPACALAGHVERPEHCLPILGHLAADVLVLAADGGDAETVLLARHLRLIYPRLALVLVLPDGPPTPAQSGLEALGVTVLPRGSLRAGIGPLLSCRDGVGRELASTADPGPMLRRGPGGPAVPSMLTQQVVTICSFKGGVGKTLVATNLAVAVAARTPARTVLIDLDVNSSDVGVHLDLLEGPTIVDMLPYLPEAGIPDLSRFLARHRPSGLDVLLGPPRSELGALVKPEHLRRILDWLRREYHLVFIDTPPDGGHELLHESLQAASRVLLVTTTDAASLRQGRVAMDTLQRLGIPEARLILVVNQVYDGGPVSLREVQDFLGVPAAVTLVSDRRAAEEAVFDGRPLVLGAPDHPLVTALLALAGKLCPGIGGDPPATPRRRFFSWVRRAVP